MIMKGQKRKLPPETPEVSDRTSPFWESQRQFVFSVSLNKYQRGQELPEPSLRRSVLIANTLRQVSLEACTAPSADGEVPQPLCDPSSPLQENVFSPSSTLSVKEEDDEWDSMSTDPDFSLSAAISSILTALDSAIDGSPQAAPRTPLRSLENLAGPSEGGVVWMRQVGRGAGGGWEQDADCRVRDSATDAMRSSYLGDLTVEDLFQDIDTSLLERDMGALGLCLTSSSSSSFNQNLKCLPSFSSFSASSSSSSPALPPPPLSGPTYLREGLELDHLMEILVES
ncbi:uncharacterized protein V6R79_015263 [Siganus canaliculatus]